MCNRRPVLMLLGLLFVCACSTASQDSPDGSQPRDDAQAQLPGAVRDAMTTTDGAASDSAVADARDSGAPDANLPSPAEPDADVAPISDGIPAGAHVFALVAPSLCTTRDGRMFECNYEPGKVDAPSLPGAGQFRTRVTGHSKGDCATQFPFLARLSAVGVEPFNFRLFDNDEVWLRRGDSSAIASVNIENGSAFAGKENYDASCRVWLEVEFNQPIVQAPAAM